MKFLQVSQARSGTHMLRAAFMAHPDVSAWWDYMGAIAHLPGRLPSFLESEYAKVASHRITGTMTHFGEQVAADTEPWRDHWRRLRELHEYAIVLVRRNSLRRYLSKRIAHRDLGEGYWASDTPRSYDPAPLQFTLPEYLAYNGRTMKIEDNIRPLLAPYHTVVYEDLVADWSGVMRHLYTYLGLRWNDPQLTTYRQETRSPEQIVENWAELIAQAETKLPDPAAETFLRQMRGAN